MPFTNATRNLIDEAFQSKSFADIAKAHPSALAGLNHADGQKLVEALDIKTIGELAANRYVLWAQAMANLAPYDRADVLDVKLHTLIDPKHEGRRLRELVKMPPSVFVGLSEKKAKVIEEVMQARSIEELATNRLVMVAQVIAQLAKYEKLEMMKQAA